MVLLVFVSAAGWAKMKLGTRSRHARAMRRRFLFMFVHSFFRFRLYFHLVAPESNTLKTYVSHTIYLIV
jgi:hypothetical protein